MKMKGSRKCNVCGKFKMNWEEVWFQDEEVNRIICDTCRRVVNSNSPQDTSDVNVVSADGSPKERGEGE